MLKLDELTSYCIFLQLMTLIKKIASIGAISAVGFTAIVAPVSAEDSEKINESAFKAMGYAMAMQMRLNAGFTEKELDHIFSGIRLAATGGDEPDAFESSLGEAQGIYMQRMQAFQAREQAKAMELAESNKRAGQQFLAQLDQDADVQKTNSGLRYRIVEEGTGEKPGPNDKVVVSYRGTLIDGTEFDSSGSAEFPVNGVVPGFSEGLQLMKEGGKIKLYIPSDLAYGDGPQRPGSVIEPGSTLIFDVQLVRISPSTNAQRQFSPPPSAPQSGGPQGGPPSRPIPPPPNYTPPPPPSSPPPIPENYRQRQNED
jgi:FKBP-type peptidyl-prolyl cis-trans isomerase